MIERKRDCELHPNAKTNEKGVAGACEFGRVDDRERLYLKAEGEVTVARVPCPG